MVTTPEEELRLMKEIEKVIKPVRKNLQPVINKRKIVCKEETLTKQSFKDECDVNKVLQKYTKTGVLPNVIKQNPMYGDFSNVTDYLTSMNTVMMAQEQFAMLSASIRQRFANDPVQFLEFCSKAENKEEMGRLGLLKPQEQAVRETLGGNPQGSDKGPAGTKSQGAPAVGEGPKT